MRKVIITSIVLCLSTTITWAEQVVIETKNTTMVLNVENNKQPQYVYYGTKLSAYDLQHLQVPRNGRMDAYPAYGMNCPAEAAIAMTHSDGNLSTELYVSGINKQGDITKINLKDPQYPVSVALCYKAYFDEDMIETWTEIKNDEAKPVTLTQFASISCLSAEVMCGSLISMVLGPTKLVLLKSLSCLARRSSRTKMAHAIRIPIMPK